MGARGPLPPVMSVALQAPLSMGFSRHEHWSGLPCPPPGDLPDPGFEPASLCLLHWWVGSLPLAPPGKPMYQHYSFPSTPAIQRQTIIHHTGNSVLFWDDQKGEISSLQLPHQPEDHFPTPRPLTSVVTSEKQALSTLDGQDCGHETDG